MSDAYEEPLFFEVVAYADAAERDVADVVSGNPDCESPPGLAAGLAAYTEEGGATFQYLRAILSGRSAGDCRAPGRARSAERSVTPC